MPAAAEGNIEQFAGRLHRDYETKTEVIIYDYVDSHIRVLEKMYHKRLRTYKKIGYKICNNVIAEKQNVNAIFGIDNFDRFLFSTWRDKPNGKGKDQISWGAKV